MMDKDQLHWNMYQEHVTQARQHENQRERMTALVVALAGATIAFVGQNGLTPVDLWMSVPLIPLGAFGAAFSRKHYERNRMHVCIASAYLTKIDSFIYGPRSSAENKHREDPEYQRQYERRLHRYWEAIPWGIAVLGAFLSLAIIGTIANGDLKGTSNSTPASRSVHLATTHTIVEPPLNLTTEGVASARLLAGREVGGANPRHASGPPPVPTRARLEHENERRCSDREVKPKPKR